MSFAIKTGTEVFTPESPDKLEMKILDWKMVAAVSGGTGIFAAAALALMLAAAYYDPSLSGLTHAEMMQFLPGAAGFFGASVVGCAVPVLAIACLLPRWNKELEESRRIHSANGNRLEKPPQ